MWSTKLGGKRSGGQPESLKKGPFAARGILDGYADHVGGTREDTPNAAAPARVGRVGTGGGGGSTCHALPARTCLCTCACTQVLRTYCYLQLERLLQLPRMARPRLSDGERLPARWILLDPRPRAGGAWQVLACTHSR